MTCAKLGSLLGFIEKNKKNKVKQKLVKHVFDEFKAEEKEKNMD